MNVGDSSGLLTENRVASNDSTQLIEVIEMALKLSPCSFGRINLLLCLNPINVEIKPMLKRLFSDTPNSTIGVSGNNSFFPSKVAPSTPLITASLLEYSPRFSLLVRHCWIWGNGSVPSLPYMLTSQVGPYEPLTLKPYLYSPL